MNTIAASFEKATRTVLEHARAHPVLALFLLIACQHALTFHARSLWWSDEVRHGAVLRQMLAQGDWILLRLNDVPYPDKPPIYFWFLGLLSQLLGSTQAWVILLGLSLTVFLATLAVYAFVRGLSGSRIEGLLAALIWASGFYLVLAAHYARMDFLFTALIILAWIAFYRAMPDRAPRRWMILGFLACGLATLTKGPFGALFPVLTLVGALLWQGRARRLWSLDTLIGLALFCGVILGWILALAEAAGWSFLASIWRGQIIDRGFQIEQPFLGHGRYFITLPLVFMPWTMLPFITGGWRVLAPAGLQKLWRERRAAEDANVFLWAAAIAGFAVLTLVREKHEYYLLPLLAPLAILTARSLLAAPENARRRFFGATALFAAVLAGTPALVEALGVVPFKATGLLLSGIVMALTAAMIWRWRAKARYAIAGLVLGQTLWINALNIVTLPSLDAVFSPAAVARSLAAHSRPDTPLAAFAFVPGTLRYDLGRPYLDFGQRTAFIDWLDQRGDALFATPRAAFDYHLSDRKDLTVVDALNLAGDQIVIVRKGPKASP